MSLLSSLESVVLKENWIKSVQPGTFGAKANLAKVDLTANQIRLLQMPALAVQIKGEFAFLRLYSKEEENTLRDL